MVPHRYANIGLVWDSHQENMNIPFLFNSIGRYLLIQLPPWPLDPLSPCVAPSNPNPSPTPLDGLPIYVPAPSLLPPPSTEYLSYDSLKHKH